MSTPSNDPNAPDPKLETNAAEQPPQEKATKLAGKALAYLAALAAATAAQAGTEAPAAEQDRAYLEALLHGSWTQPPDLSQRRLAPSVDQPSEHDPGLDQGFNDTWNPNPKPYTDTHYVDTGFGDRTP
jgi:hypothetical protein